MKQFVINDVDLLLMGLRYLELHHPEKTYRAEFRELLNDVYAQLNQTSMFEGNGD